ncbi:MAG: hypothetical protein QXL15_02295 [Candidatus Korarchaeota archaeon]
MLKYASLYELNVGAISLCVLEDASAKKYLLVLTSQNVICFDATLGKQQWFIPAKGKGIVGVRDTAYLFDDYEITVIGINGSVLEKHIVSKRIRHGFAADMDRDGNVEGVFAADGMIFIMKGKDLVSKREIFVEDALFYDWDGDDIKELVVLTSKLLYVYDFGWKEIAKEKVSNGRRLLSADINGDDRDELIVISENEMWVYSGNEKKDEYAIPIIPNFIARYDFDQDGITEIIFGDEKSVFIIRENTILKSPYDLSLMLTLDITNDATEEVIIIQNGVVKVITEARRIALVEIKYPPVGFVGDTLYLSITIKNTNPLQAQNFAVLIATGNELSGTLAPNEENTIMIPVYIDNVGTYSFNWKLRDAYGEIPLPPFFISAVSRDEIVETLKKLAQHRRVSLQTLKDEFKWITTKDLLSRVIEIGMEAGIYIVVSGNMLLFNEDAIMEMINELEKHIGRVLASGWRVPFSSLLSTAGIDKEKLLEIIANEGSLIVEEDTIIIPQNSNIRKIARTLATEIIKRKTKSSL